LEQLKRERPFLVRLGEHGTRGLLKNPQAQQMGRFLG